MEPEQQDPMIAADHKKWADLIFCPYIIWLCKQHFFSIRLIGSLPACGQARPLLLLPNHSSWWDGFFAYLLNKRVFNRKGYLMMLEEQLQKNRFFRYLGVYSIDPSTFKGVKESLAYTTTLLNNKNESPLVCVFPQGELQPWHSRPIVLKKGLDMLLRSITEEIDLAFLGIRVELLGEQRPDVFLQISPLQPIHTHSRYSLSDLQFEFNAFLDQLERAILNGERGQILLQGKRSVNERFRFFKRDGGSC